jgi:small subunit ribosomal protein S20e
MASIVKKENKGEETSQTHKIRITLSGRNPKAIEKVSSDLLSRAKDQQIKVRGPLRLPTRTLKITTRKTPCGNGTNTWDVYEMKIYKRVIDLFAQQEVVKTITAINIEAGVDVEVTVTDV